MTQPPDDLVEARIVETVQIWPPGEPADPFWRIEIDGFCADFDFQEAAENFAAAINRRIDAATITALRQRVAELEGAVLAETERCAKIADEEAECLGDGDDEAGDYWIASCIARRIRNRSNDHEG